MKFIVQGCHLTKVYDVQKFGSAEDGYYQEPEFVGHIHESKWETIFEFEAESLVFSRNYVLPYVGEYYDLPGIHLSADEVVGIQEQIHRADLGVVYLKSNKVLSLKEDKETNKQAYDEALEEYKNYSFNDAKEVQNG